MRKALFFMLLLLLASCSKSKKAARPAPTVLVTSIEQREVPIYIDSIGEAIPPVTVQVTPQVGGKLLKVFVQQGADVNFGDTLYTIDPRPFQDAVDQAQAQLEHDQALYVYAQKAVERYKTVVENDFLAILTYEQYVSTAEAAKAQVALDEAALASAKLNLEFSNVVAPVTGKISFYNIDVGNIVTANDATAITVIRPNAPIDVTFSLPQKYFELIRAEQGVNNPWQYIATLPEHPNEPFEGETYFIDNQINQDTGTILLKGRLPNMKKQLWPGAYVAVRVLYKRAPQALVVPPGAVLMGKNGPYVYTVKDSKAEAHTVNVLTRENSFIAFESTEVHKGDTVVVEGQINIAPGMTVQIKQETNSPSTGPKSS